MSASLRGGVGGILPSLCWISNPHHLSWWETVSDGQFDWGGRLLKCNGGARWCAQTARKSVVECNGISPPDCETDKSSRDESRS